MWASQSCTRLQWSYMWAQQNWTTFWNPVLYLPTKPVLPSTPQSGSIHPPVRVHPPPSQGSPSLNSSVVSIHKSSIYFIPVPLQEFLSSFFSIDLLLRFFGLSGCGAEWIETAGTVLFFDCLSIKTNFQGLEWMCRDYYSCGTESDNVMPRSTLRQSHDSET